MRKAAVKAQLLNATSSFALLWQHECEVLYSLPSWMTRLFVHLVQLADFRSGAGTVTYGQLVGLMTPIQPRSGPQHYVPNERAVRKAVLAFEERHIVARDKASSQKGHLLFLWSWAEAHKFAQRLNSEG